MTHAGDGSGGGERGRDGGWGASPRMDGPRVAAPAWRARAHPADDDGDADPFGAGPYTRLQAALRLPSPASARAAWRRALTAGAVAWLPLLLLALLGGPSARASFLQDVAAHARYLLAVPLLVAAEPWCLPRLAVIARHFGRAGVVAGEDRACLEALLASARRWAGHRGPEAVLAAVAFAAALGTSGVPFPRGVPLWAGEAGRLAPAGWWRAGVAQPLFLLLCGMWLWRTAVWTRFLWGVSRLRLRLVPAHPDLAAGLRFLAASLGAFIPVALALGTVAAGTVAGEMMRGAHPALAHGVALGAGLAATLLAFAGPLLAFCEPLRRARLRGAAEYGALASAVGRSFEERWLGRRLDPGVLAAPDFSAVADLYAVVANVRAMGLLPFGPRDLAPLAAAVLLPFVPLVLLVVPPDELLRRLAHLFL